MSEAVDNLQTSQIYLRQNNFGVQNSFENYKSLQNTDEYIEDII